MELSLPDPFTGVLRWSVPSNRPLCRALHGLALTWWRYGVYEIAAATLQNLLWINPDDDQGARLLLPRIRTWVPWEWTAPKP